MLGRAKVVLEAVGVQTEVDKNRVGLVDGHHLQAGGVELEVGLRQNLLQSLNERAESPSLYRADLEKVAVDVGFRKGGTHLYAGAVPSLSKWPRRRRLVWRFPLPLLLLEPFLITSVSYHKRYPWRRTAGIRIVAFATPPKTLG